MSLLIGLAELVIQHESRIRRLEEQQEESMVQLQDVQDQVNALVAEDSVVVAALNDLKQKADSGQQVTAADLQGLHDQLATEVGRLNDAVQSTDPAPVADTGAVNSSPNPATQPDQAPVDAGPQAPTGDLPTAPTAPDAGPVDSSGNPVS